MENIEICPKCGCKDVEALAWIHVNSKEWIDWSGGEVWCPDCEQYV